jgi:hypothetical protein
MAARTVGVVEVGMVDVAICDALMHGAVMYDALGAKAGRREIAGSGRAVNELLGSRRAGSEE